MKVGRPLKIEILPLIFVGAENLSSARVLANLTGQRTCPCPYNLLSMLAAREPALDDFLVRRLRLGVGLGHVHRGVDGARADFGAELASVVVEPLILVGVADDALDVGARL